jgi:hypothetical protein
LYRHSGWLRGRLNSFAGELPPKNSRLVVGGGGAPSGQREGGEARV